MATPKPLKYSEMMAQELSSLAKNHALLQSTDKIPATLVTQLFRGMVQEGKAISKLLTVEGDSSQPLATATTGFETAATGLHFVDILIPPLIFLTEYLSGKRPQFTLTRAARLGYSGVLLALVITSLAVPVTAPFIAISVSGMGLGLSSFMVGYSLYKRYKTQQEKKQIEEALQQTLEKLQNIQQQTQRTEELLSNDPDLQTELDRLMQQFEQERTQLESLYDKKNQCDIQLKHNNTATIVGKSIPIIAYSLILTGLVVSLFFPPVGLGILAGGSALALTYTVTKLSAPIIKRSVEWFKKPLSQKTTPEPETKAPSHQDKPQLSEDESTKRTIAALCANRKPTPHQKETTQKRSIESIQNESYHPLNTGEEEGEGEGEKKIPPSLHN